MRLPRDLCYAAYNLDPPNFESFPLQLGMRGCPWRVAVASMLLNRTRRVQVEPVLRVLLTRWPTPGDLARAGPTLEAVVKPCGLHRNRARQLSRFSWEWLGAWDDMRDLPGVGVYCADAVALFCFGCKELQSDDWVLRQFAERYDGPCISTLEEYFEHQARAG